MALIPYVIERTGNTERSYDLYSRLLTDRVVMLCEEVTDSLASVICAQLLYLDSQNPGSDISLYINSPGGSVSAGLAIYDTMNYISADVQTICMGMAASMGAFLLCSGTKGKRMCLPNSEVMIHQPLGGAQGQASDIRIQADHILRTKQRLTDIIAKNTGRTYEEVESACDRDNWLSPEAALDFGLIDKIIEKR